MDSLTHIPLALQGDYQPPYLLARLSQENHQLTGHVLSRHDTLAEALAARACALGAGPCGKLAILAHQVDSELLTAHCTEEDMAELELPLIENVRYRIAN